MGILHRYIVFAMIKATFSIFFIALAVTLFVEFANEARYLGESGYGIIEALLYMLMTLPSDLYALFPMIGLLGVLIGLGLLASNHELLVMRASGLSLFAIMRSVFLAALLISIMAILMGEVISPKWLNQAKNLKQQAISGNQAVETERGIWIHVENDFFNIAQVITRDHWLGVTRYHINQDNQLISETWAKSVEYKNQHWLASNVKETLLFSDHTQSIKYKRQIWTMPLTPSAFAYGFNEAQEMSLMQLYRLIHYRVVAQLPLDRYLLDFWRRIFQPIAMLVMMMIAVPFVFVSSRSGAMGVRILLGILLSLGFYLISQLMGQSSLVFRLPAWLGAFLPILIFFLLGLWLLRRVK